MVRFKTGSSQGAALVLNFLLDLTISKEAAQTVKKENVSLTPGESGAHPQQMEKHFIGLNASVEIDHLLSRCPHPEDVGLCCTQFDIEHIPNIMIIAIISQVIPQFS